MTTRTGQPDRQPTRRLDPRLDLGGDTVRGCRERSNGLVAPWMRFAVCQDFPELPWIDDADTVDGYDQVSMRSVCRACGVFEECAAYTVEKHITGGFWAGAFRDTHHPCQSVTGASVQAG